MLRKVSPFAIGATVWGSAFVLMIRGISTGDWYGYFFAAMFVAAGTLFLGIIFVARRRVPKTMELRDKIINAFASAPQPRVGEVSAPTYDDEGTAAYFTGKHWQGHSVADLRRHSNSLSFFTPAAFRYYLPAFMLAEIDAPEGADVIAEGILFHFTSGTRSDEILRLMTAEERDAVAAFFEECGRRYDCDGFRAGAQRVR